MKHLVAAILCLLALVPNRAHADLHLPEPSQLLQEASQGKDQLRDVINQIDENLAEMRDAKTFDKYFFLLDDLQALYEKLGLGMIYPDAVKKLGDRMSQKGVNWIEVANDSEAKVLYYQKWMGSPQTAFAFLYLADPQIRAESDLKKLENAAKNLEASLVFAQQRWPNEQSLLLLYRSTISDLAVRVMKTGNLTVDQTDFWISKIYTSQPMGDIVVLLANESYSVKAVNKGDLHRLVGELNVIFHHVSAPEFGAPEFLLTQLSDTAVDLVARSLRLQEQLTDAEFEGALSIMQPHGLTSLAENWSAIVATDISPAFAQYYVEKADRFVRALQEQNLSNEAKEFTKVIAERSAAVMARAGKLEGFYDFTDSDGHRGHLNIVLANENNLFVDLSMEHRPSSPVIDVTFPFFYVSYDVKKGAYVVAKRSTDTDRAYNFPLVLIPRNDGTIKIVNLSLPWVGAEAVATKVQTYPDLFAQKRENAPDVTGVYQGAYMLGFDHAVKTVEMAIVATGNTTIGNMAINHLDVTFNYGSSSLGGIIYLTQGSDNAVGYWVHLRMVLDNDGHLNGYVIDGQRGLLPLELKWKLIRSIQ